MPQRCRGSSINVTTLSLPRADVRGCVWLGWTVWRLRLRRAARRLQRAARRLRRDSSGGCGGTVLRLRRTLSRLEEQSLRLGELGCAGRVHAVALDKGPRGGLRGVWGGGWQRFQETGSPSSRN